MYLGFIIKTEINSAVPIFAMTFKCLGKNTPYNRKVVKNLGY